MFNIRPIYWWIRSFRWVCCGWDRLRWSDSLWRMHSCEQLNIDHIRRVPEHRPGCHPSCGKLRQEMVVFHVCVDLDSILLCSYSSRTHTDHNLGNPEVWCTDQFSLFVADSNFSRRTGSHEPLKLRQWIIRRTVLCVLRPFHAYFDCSSRNRWGQRWEQTSIYNGDYRLVFPYEWYFHLPQNSSTDKKHRNPLNLGRKPSFLSVLLYCVGYKSQQKEKSTKWQRWFIPRTDDGRPYWSTAHSGVKKFPLSVVSVFSKTYSS